MVESIPLIERGSKAPSFNFYDAEGQLKNIRSLKGNPIIIFFYPKDNTPGCTKEACGFADEFETFKKAGVTVIGVSPDNEKSHAKFTEKFKLPFPLVADVDRKIIEAYGVWGRKKFMGREYDGVHRTTFLINKQGNIDKIYTKVNPAQHAAEIRKDLNL